MSVATELTPTAAPTVKRTNPLWKGFRSRLSAALRALAAGTHASKDYRLLNRMSAGQLRMLGLTHENIPRELYRRHFAKLSAAIETPE